MKTAVLRFEPPSGDQGATYDDHLRLVGKRVGDFVLVLIDFFSLGRTTEALRAIIVLKSAISLQRGPVDPKLVNDFCQYIFSFWKSRMLSG